MKEKTILFGIGNCGRADDGLGWAFLDKIKAYLPNNYDIEYRYQLQVEDAELATNYKNVVFIDAHHQSFEKGYIWKKCHPKATESFTTHELDPESVLYLTETIYNKHPKAAILGITGDNYCLEMGLSPAATKNLSKALNFYKNSFLNPINLGTDKSHILK